MAEAITNMNGDGSGIDLRTVQLWFQDNDKGVSSENIHWLARLFGCDDPDATSAWQAELSAAHGRLVADRNAKRKTGKSVFVDMTTLGQGDHLPSQSNTRRATNSSMQKRGFNIARRSEALFSSASPLNMPALVWAGWIVIGLLAYALGVHSVTYTPIQGLEKQVGFFWAPNWTLLELVILPLFLISVMNLLAYWKQQRQLIDFPADCEFVGEVGWALRVKTFSFSHWMAFFVCFFAVFLLQWSTVHMSALLTSDRGDLMIDWNLIVIVRPDVLSVSGARALSMLAFLYTATISFMFLTGLILICTVVQDFSAIYADLQIQDHEGPRQDIRAVRKSLMCEIFRATVLGIAIATCIKLQATYLQSTGENIVNWLVADARLSLGIGHHVASGWLNQRSIAHFTSFLLLFSTCSVFLFGVFQIRWNANRVTGFLGKSTLPPAHRIRWWSMFSVVLLLASNFLLIGQFAGFSIMLLVSVLIAIYSIYDPTFGERAAQIEVAGKA